MSQTPAHRAAAAALCTGDCRRSSTASCAARRRWCCFASWRATPAPGRNSAPAACWTAGRCRLREREIVIDRTCARTGCEYEWGVHVATFADAAHLTEEQVRATVLGDADAACWSAAEQALIAAVDALHDRATLSEAEFAALSAHYDEAQIFWRSSCSAASIARCRIWRTGWRCRWRRRRRGFRTSVMRCVERSGSGCSRARNDALQPRRRATDRADARCRPACRRRSRSAR